MDELEVMDVIGIVDLWMRKPRLSLNISFAPIVSGLDSSQLTQCFPLRSNFQVSFQFSSTSF